MGIYIPHEDVERAGSVGLYDYFRMTDPTVLRRKGRDFCHKDHDSLCMKKSGEWWWHSRGLYGRNAISYLIIAEDMDFQSAVLAILGASPTDYVPENNKDNVQCEDNADDKYRVLMIPEKDVDSDIVRKYLISRGIDDGVIEYFITEGSIYQDKRYKSVCFVGFDRDNVPRLINVRGTRGTFKQNVAGSDRRFGFMNRCDEKDSVHLFEAPIDMLSYACLINEAGHDFREFNLFSMSGITGSRRTDGSVKLPSCLEQYFNDYPGIQAVYIHFDNDAAGRNAGINIASALKPLNIKAYMQYPPDNVKDVNEYLQMKRMQQRNELSDIRMEAGL
ncbi:MAG: DUF3991 and toprim domain-containing protein [Eubacterium sp.]|nr:DUF3991 and toprim domain-containing protein [Eubacterium sp.]